MNEDIFKEILAKAVDCEFAEFDNAPEHKFSLKHRFAMKWIFAKYEKNVRKLRGNETTVAVQVEEYKPRYGLSRRLFLAMIVIILASFLVGWVVVYVSTNFHGTVFSDNTQLTAKNLKECPQTIEYKYALASVPDGFEMIQTNSSPIHVYTLYMNNLTNQTITLRQIVKSRFESHYNTEHQPFEEICINGSIALYVDLGDDEYDCSLLIWDNKDYVFEIRADLNKDLAINLCNFNKIENK